MAQTIDQRLMAYPWILDKEQEDEAARENRITRQEELQRRSAGENQMRQTAQSMGKVMQEHNKREAVKQGIITGLRLRGEIADGRFDGSTFYTVLLLCVIKDLIDLVGVATLGIAGILANFFIVPLLFIIFFLKKARLKKFLIKRFIWPIIIEFTPLNFFPSYTVGVIMLKLKVDEKNRTLAAQAEQIEKETEQLKKQA